MPNRRKTTLEQDLEIIKLHSSNLSRGQIASQIPGIGTSVVDRVLMEHGIQKRNSTEAINLLYPRNKSCFDIITSESAYWIGFLMADGCISDNGCITLSLKASDINHLEKFRTFVGSNNRIGHVFKRNSSNSNISEAVQFRIMDKDMSNTLKQYGVIPRKTNIAVAHKSLVGNRDFWRGMIDGDGSIYIHKTEKYKDRVALAFCGSKDIVEQWKIFIKNFIPDYDNIPVKSRNSRDNYELTLNTNKALIIIETLYTDCNIALDRKFKIASNLLYGGRNGF